MENKEVVKEVEKIAVIPTLWKWYFGGTLEFF